MSAWSIGAHFIQRELSDKQHGTYECRTCHALVWPDMRSMQAHTEWHEQTMADTMREVILSLRNMAAPSD